MLFKTSLLEKLKHTANMLKHRCGNRKVTLLRKLRLKRTSILTLLKKQLTIKIYMI